MSLCVRQDQDLMKNTRPVIDQRREIVWSMLAKGMKSYEIAQELKVDPSTISRDVQYLTSQSQKFLDNMAKETLPFMYKSCIDGIRIVLKECWNIYESDDKQVNYFQRLAALGLTARRGFVPHTSLAESFFLTSN